MDKCAGNRERAKRSGLPRMMRAGKSVSEKSKSTGGKCVSENSSVGNLVRHGQVATPSRRQEVRSLNTSLM
jgi:hypothetical protein